MDCGRRHLTGAESRAFSISEITAQCGLGTGTFYGYFKNKDDFILQIIEDDWRAILRDIEENVNPEKSNYENAKYLYGIVAAFEQRYAFTAAGSLSKSGELAAQEKGSVRQTVCVVAEKLRQAQANGRLRTDVPLERLAFLLLQLCFAAGRSPDIRFEDFWGLLHLRGDGLGEGEAAAN